MTASCPRSWRERQSWPGTTGRTAGGRRESQPRDRDDGDEGTRATHLEVGVDGREPPRLAPRAHAHARKLLLDVVHLPPICALLALALGRAPRPRERVPRLEPAARQGAALLLEAVPREVTVGDRVERELVVEVVARAEDERGRLAGEGGRGARHRVEERERDLQMCESVSSRFPAPVARLASLSPPHRARNRDAALTQTSSPLSSTRSCSSPVSLAVVGVLSSRLKTRWCAVRWSEPGVGWPSGDESGVSEPWCRERRTARDCVQRRVCQSYCAVRALRRLERRPRRRARRSRPSLGGAQDLERTEAHLHADREVGFDVRC